MELDLPRGIKNFEWYEQYLKTPDSLVGVKRSRRDGKTILAHLVGRKLHKEKKKVLIITNKGDMKIGNWRRATKIMYTSSSKLVNKHLKRKNYDYIIIDEPQIINGTIDHPVGTKVLTIGSPSGGSN